MKLWNPACKTSALIFIGAAIFVLHPHRIFAQAPGVPIDRDEILIASDASGNVFPVTAVLAQDKEMDGAIVRVEGGNFTPLALNDQTAPGDAVYIFSDPMSVVGYFTSGYSMKPFPRAA